MSTFESLQVEAQTHVRALMNGMLALEQHPAAAVEQVETCVRAVRSLKTVARIAGWRASADLARAMEMPIFTECRERHLGYGLYSHCSIVTQ